jgi:3-phosphoshikimate 1-carboxyvinyltransferase
MSEARVNRVEKAFEARFTPPGSKSLTNRALVLAALGEGACELNNVLFADDTLVMLDGLSRLGFGVEIDRGAKRVTVRGGGGRIPGGSAELFCGNSGTTIRFLTALVALGTGEYVLDGVGRMRERPIGELVRVLKDLGVRSEYEMREGYPPVRVRAHGLPGGLMTYGAAQSSQFLSAVLQVAPYAKHEVRVALEGRQTSWPYVAMTMKLMDEFGVMVELVRDPMTGEPREIIVPKGRYTAGRYDVEPDASNATYFLAAAALHPGSKVTVEGLGKGSLQGDVGFADVLHQMGAGLVFGRDFITVTGTKRLEGIEVDLSAMPDTAQTLAVTALFAEGETRITGLHTLRVKETDRLAAVATELRKFGAGVEIEGDDALVITPPAVVRPATVDTYDDHRMAMSFALAGTRTAGVVINDPGCTAKTYPEYFEDLERVVRSSPSGV